MDNRSQLQNQTADPGLPVIASHNADPGLPVIASHNADPGLPVIASHTAGTISRADKQTSILSTSPTNKCQTDTEGNPEEPDTRFASWRAVSRKGKTKPLAKGGRVIKARRKTRRAKRGTKRKEASAARQSEGPARGGDLGRPQVKAGVTRQKPEGSTTSTTSGQGHRSEGLTVGGSQGGPCERLRAATGETQKQTATTHAESPSGSTIPLQQTQPKQHLGQEERLVHKPAYQDDTMSPQGEQKKQRLNSPNQTPEISNSQVAKSDLQVAVTGEKTGQITQELANIVLRDIQQKILEEAMARQTTTEGPPEFRGKPIVSDGALKLWCITKGTVEWLKRVVAGVATATGEALVVKRQSQITKRVRCGIVIPERQGVWKDAVSIACTLSYLNPWASVDQWLMQHAEKQEENWFIIFTMPEDHIPTLMERRRQMSFGAGTVYVKFQGKDGKFDVVPPGSEEEASSTPKTS